MKKINIVIICFFLSGCSSLKKTLIYSASSGALAGAVAGAALSPNKESRKANALVFGLVGAGVAGSIGYLLHQDDPRNYKLQNMLVEHRPQDLQLDLETIKINMGLNKKEAYTVPVKELPKALMGKVGRQFVIKHESKEQYLRRGEKTYFIPSFSIYEHSYSLPTEKNEQ